MRIAIIMLSIQLTFPLFAQQQIEINRITQMPDYPLPYEMRDWKKVAEKYDTLIFSRQQEGTYLPLLSIGNTGVNYPDILPIFLSTVMWAQIIMVFSGKRSIYSLQSLGPPC